jgi:hypothetical protein
MVALITVAGAKRRLRLDFADDDVLASELVNEATAIVLNHLKGRANPAWTEASVPFDVKAAIYLAFGRLYANRDGTEEILSDPVKALLHSYRDPALA